MQEENSIVVPRHLGFIVDGNRRWAKSHGIPAYEGHMAGFNVLKDISLACFERGVSYVSFYAFSTENWKREKGEVSKLMRLTYKIATYDVKELIKRQVRLRFIGIEDGLDEKLVEAIRKAEADTKDFKNGSILVCFNYGGQREIADAARKCVEDGLKPEEVTEAAIAERLYAPDVPAIDMIVRTSGEQRLSNFMLWRSAYSEFLFLQKYWPDMTPQDIDDIIKEYNKRNRRFGGN